MKGEHLMRRTIPVIHEPIVELKQRLQRERDGRRKLRLQMLYLLASAQAQTRQDIAHLLGGSRNTVGRWLTDYEQGGVTALLNLYVPPGKHPSLPPDVLASIEAALHQPHGVASSYDLQAWVEHTHGISVKYKTLYAIVRHRFKTKLKVPRPSHIKKDSGGA
jgi:transposase